ATPACAIAAAGHDPPGPVPRRGRSGAEAREVVRATGHAARELDRRRAQVGRTSLPQDGTARTDRAPGAPECALRDTVSAGSADADREYITGSNVVAKSARLM